MFHRILDIYFLTRLPFLFSTQKVKKVDSALKSSQLNTKTQIAYMYKYRPFRFRMDSILILPPHSLVDHVRS